MRKIEKVKQQAKVSKMKMNKEEEDFLRIHKNAMENYFHTNSKLKEEKFLFLTFLFASIFLLIHLSLFY